MVAERILMPLLIEYFSPFFDIAKIQTARVM